MKKKQLYSIIGTLAILAVGYFVITTLNSKEPIEEKEINNTNFYTCSMHPQVKQPEPGNCPICNMELIAFEDETEGLKPNEFKMSANAVALGGIETEMIRNLNRETQTLKLSGQITENKESYQVQSAYYNGRIEQLFINYEGEKIKKGQPLATIYAPELIQAQQELITAARLKQSQPALYKAIRNKLKLWKLTNNQINQIEASGEVKNTVTIYAIASGIASEIKISAGDYVTKGAPILKITSLATVWAVFDAHENQLASLEKGQPIKITLNAVPEEVYNTTIDFIAPVLNQDTRVAGIRAQLTNKNEALKPGMFVEGYPEITGKSKEQYLQIPTSAVLWTGKRAVVYLKKSKLTPLFEMQEVLLGNKLNDKYEVLQGLKPYDEIVINGTFMVDAAAQLAGKKSMMNRAPAKNTDTRIPAAFENSFQPLIAIYLELKDALVESNAITAAAKAKQFKVELAQIAADNKSFLEGSWTILYSRTNIIANAQTIEIQRSAFRLLSEKMIAILMQFKEPYTPIYIQKCPMASNNEGGLWLSAESEIKNPYFGDQMLTCGEVENVLFK